MSWADRLALLIDRSPRENARRLRRKMAGRAALEDFDAAHPCLFVLSTGRTGTTTLTALYRLAPNLWSVHEPDPKLFRLSRLYYELRSGANGAEDRERLDRLFAEAFLALRMPAFSIALGGGTGYAECGPPATFLAPVIDRALPQARFIHLVRDPREVVRSAMRRGWYQGGALDANRIVPLPDSPAGRAWSRYDAFRRNVWSWAETNRWIGAFCAGLPRERWLRVRAEDVFAGDEATIAALYRFASTAAPPARRVRAVLGRRLNRQRSGAFRPYRDWSEEERRFLVHLAGPVASELGYDLA